MSKTVYRLSFSQPLLARMVTVMLLCGMGYLLAMLSWQTGELLFPQTPASTQVKRHKPQVAPAEIRFNTLFHERKNEEAAAARSSLKVRLAGVIVSSAAENSLVIIEQDGKQRSYGPDETIGGTQASIVAIHPDAVELLNAGQREILRLYDDAVSHGPDEQATTRDRLLAEPKKLLELVAITPVNKEGALQGYRLNPGKEATFFQQSGLQPNDLAIAINGFDLRAPQEAAKLMAQLGELTQLDITVVRDAAEKNIFVDLSNK